MTWWTDSEITISISNVATDQDSGELDEARDNFYYTSLISDGGDDNEGDSDNNGDGDSGY